jgi:nucleoid DNA-binding protein
MANKNLLKLITNDGKSEPEAADDLARVVETILRRLRKGEVVTLPGLGKLVPGPKPGFRLERPVKGGAGGKR